MNQTSLPVNQKMNDGMREALNKSVSTDAMKKVSDMMLKTAKMLAMGHMDPAYMMETMDMMQALMPNNAGQPPEDQGQGPGMEMEMEMGQT
jgi:hypothetical protein